MLGTLWLLSQVTGDAWSHKLDSLIDIIEAIHLDGTIKRDQDWAFGHTVIQREAEDKEPAQNAKKE
jgi:hypothetical protein